jgi:TnpA family transposase
MSYILTEPQLTAVKQKDPKNQLLFAALLKYFEAFNKPLDNVAHAPIDLINDLAKQLQVKVSNIAQVSERTIQLYQKQILGLLGFKERDKKFESQFVRWLYNDVLPKDHYSTKRLSLLSQQYCEDQKVVPFTDDYLNRVLKSSQEKFKVNTFQSISEMLTQSQKDKLVKLLEDHENDIEQSESWLTFTRRDSSGLSRKAMNIQIEKYDFLNDIQLPDEVLENVHQNILMRHYSFLGTQKINRIADMNHNQKYALLAIYTYLRKKMLLDELTDILILLIKRMKKRAEANIKEEFKTISAIKKSCNASELCYNISVTCIDNEDKTIKEGLFPIIPKTELVAFVLKYKASGKKYTYYNYLHHKIRKSYTGHYRSTLIKILNSLDLKTNNKNLNISIEAIEFIKKNSSEKGVYYADTPPLTGVIKKKQLNLVVEETASGERINRINYELCVLRNIRKQIKCKEIWTEGSQQYQNPDKDLPQDFEDSPDQYYELLDKPSDVKEFINERKKALKEALDKFDLSFNQGNPVVIQLKPYGHIYLPKSKPQKEPKNLKIIKDHILKKWGHLNLLDVLKETDLHIGLTSEFTTLGDSEKINKVDLQKRILLAIFAYGTNTGLKRVSAGCPDFSYDDLRYVRMRYLNKENLTQAIISIVNRLLKVRRISIWGDSSSAISSDSKKLLSYDQNLISEWHPRYHSKGIMIYWHIDKKSSCIHSQLRRCTSSEVAAMMQGILHHCTNVKVKKNYADTHGGSYPAFGFAGLLNYELLVRFKNIAKQKLFIVSSEDKETYKNIQPIIKQSINWDLIESQYDQLIKYASALKLGTADAEVLMKRFSRNNYSNPVYRALCELGKANKSIFLCNYLSSEALRQEIQEGLNVVERWNGVNDFIFYGKAGEVCTNKTEDQELAVLSLHLVQMSVVYMNTLLIQQVVDEQNLMDVFTIEDYRAITPIIHEHINPYGIFPLDLSKRIPVKFPSRMVA